MNKVSVILPCYNGSRWIKSAIESVLAQTYPDFELIVVDDGSTDNSKEILASYLYDRRFRYLHQENKGFSAAINRGIKESSGNLIGFIGQDDLCMPNKLELQLRYLRENTSVDLVHSNYCVIDSEDKLVKLRYIRIPEATSKKKLVKEMFLKNFIGHETVLVKKKCFDDVGLFDEKMVGCSDHDMWMRIIDHFNIGYIDTILVKKREHEGQLSQLRIDAMIKDEFLLVQKAINRHPFLKMVVGKKLSHLYYWWGLVLLKKGNKKKAKEKFLKSIKCQPFNIKSFMAYVSPYILCKIITNRYRKATVDIHKILSARAKKK